MTRDQDDIFRAYEAGAITDREYVGLVLESYGPGQIKNRVYRLDVW